MNRGKEKPKPEVYRPPVIKYRKDIGKYLVKKSKPEEKVMRQKQAIKENIPQSICKGLYLSLLLGVIWIIFITLVYLALK